MLLITEMFGINEEVKRLVERGGHVKGISDISYADIAPAQEVLDIGEELRHYEAYGGYISQWWIKNTVLAQSTSILSISR